MKPLSLVLERLKNYKPSSKGYTACCPAHDDRDPSLSITEGDDGRVLVYCHAGCTVEAIAGALGLEMRDLMPEQDGFRSPPQRAAKKAKPKATFATADEALRTYGQLGQLVRQWEYHDREGKLVGIVARWNRPNGTKTIRPVALYGASWRMEAMPYPRPLYGLPNLRDEPTVLVIEGEKVADAARSLGFVATTSAGGSQAADKTDWRPLAGKDVWVLRDFDGPGEKYALDVARLATTSGARVKILDPVKVFRRSDLLQGYDLADAVAECMSEDARVGLREQLNMIADDTEVWQPPPELNHQPNRAPAKGEYRQELDIVCMADVEPEEVEWLWPQRIPFRACTLVVGRPGVGKSFFTFDLVARISTGASWPDGSPAPKGEVLIISAEDDAATTIAPRLKACDADRRKVFVLKAVRVVDVDQKVRTVAFDLSNIDLIRAFLQAHPNIRLLIIDPIGSYLSAGVDTYRDNEVRAFLTPLVLLANEYRLAVLLVCHTRKGEVQFADDAVLGSRAFSGLARATMHISLDKDNRKRRLVLPGKSNWADTPSGLAYTIAGTPPRIEWEAEPLDDMHADDVLGNRKDNEGRRGPLPEALRAAMDWLRNLLGDGPLEALCVHEQADQAGQSWGTVCRAKDTLGIVPKKPSFKGGWVWSLPPEDAHDG